MAVLLQRLPWLATALWWGSLTTIGFLVVPMLFAYLPTPSLAGTMAARLFTAQTWVTVVCTLTLLLATRPQGDGTSSDPRLAELRLPVLGGLLLAVFVEFAVAPRIVARENLALWHRVGSALYLLQWVCASWALWRMGRRA